MLPSQQCSLALLFVLAVGCVFFLSNQPHHREKATQVWSHIQKNYLQRNFSNFQSFLEKIENVKYDDNGTQLEDLEKTMEFDTIDAVFSNFNATYSLEKAVADTCDEINMVVYVMTMGDEKSYLKRKFIRQVILSQTAKKQVLIRFFLGKHENMRMDLLEPEIERYNDIVYYNYTDFYRDNLIKWHSMHEWHLRNCGNVKWFLKLDDDTSVFFPRLFYWIDRNFDKRTDNIENYFICSIMSGFKPVRSRSNTRWSLSLDRDPSKSVDPPRYISYREYPKRYWPNYCYGYFVLTTTSTIRKIVEHTKDVRILHMDDVLFTGVIADKANVTVIHWPGVTPMLDQNHECGSDGTPMRIAVHNSKTPVKMHNDLKAIENTPCS